MADIPQDILLCVLDLMEFQSERFKLLLVCRAWYLNLQPAIWATILVGSWRQLKSTTRVISANRDLGRLVKSLRITDVPVADGHYRYTRSDMSTDELMDLYFQTPPPRDLESDVMDPDIEELVEAADFSDIAQSVLERTHPWPSSRFIEQCKFAVFDCEVHSLVMILLLLLPNLRMFEVSTRLIREYMEDLFDLFSLFSGPGGHFSNSSGVFLNLEQFRVIGAYTHYTSANVFSAVSCLPVFHLPALKVLYLDLVMFDSYLTDDWWLSPFFPAPGSLLIQELHLRTATSDEAGAMDLIHACKRLVSFSWQVSGFIPHFSDNEDNEDRAEDEDAPSTDEDGDPVPGNMVREALMQHSESLELLRYNDRDRYGSSDENRDSWFWFGPMAKFTALRDLRIRVHYLIHPSCSPSSLFPPNLEHLTLTGISTDDLPELVRTALSVLAVKATAIPKLEMLTVELAFPYNGPNMGPAEEHIIEDCTSLSVCETCLKPVLRPIERACEKAGVRWDRWYQPFWVHR